MIQFVGLVRIELFQVNRSNPVDHKGVVVCRDLPVHPSLCWGSHPMMRGLSERVMVVLANQLVLKWIFVWVEAFEDNLVSILGCIEAVLFGFDGPCHDWQAVELTQEARAIRWQILHVK